MAGEQHSGVITRAVIAAAGIYFIPGIGEIAITVTEAILIAGGTVAVGTWQWSIISSWFADYHSQKIARIRVSVPSSLRKANGDVDLSKFTIKLKKRVREESLKWLEN
ncbi:hypothetical protein RQN30_02990 [Arcanobacterium hippocoleae]